MKFKVFFIYLVLALALMEVLHDEWKYRNELIAISVVLAMLFTAWLWSLLGVKDHDNEPAPSRPKSIEVGDCLKPRQLIYDKTGKIIYEDQV